MNILIRAAIMMLCMGVIPFFTGLLHTRRKMQDADSVLHNWVSGFVICLGIFQLIAIPCIFLEKSLTTLSIVYIGILVIISVVSLVWNGKRVPQIVRSFWNMLKQTPWITIFAVLVILFQVYMYAAYTHIDDDDAFYVATALTSVEEDSLFQTNPYTGEEYSAFPARYVLSPFPIFIAALSRLSGIHATLLAHTFLPVVLLPLIYAVICLIGYELFQHNRKNTACFVLITAIVQMFASTTVYMQGSFMLLRIWQGKAVLVAALLPFLFYLGIRGTTEKLDWSMIVVSMFACCMVSSMGIALGAVMLGIMGLVLAIIKKNVWIFGKMCLCAVPNLLYMIIYVLL